VILNITMKAYSQKNSLVIIFKKICLIFFSSRNLLTISRFATNVLIFMSNESMTPETRMTPGTISVTRDVRQYHSLGSGREGALGREGAR